MATDLWQDIHDERENQDEQWGGAKHDDTHNAHDWSVIRARLDNQQVRLEDPREQRKKLVKIAAVTVAQIESLDRKLYEKETGS